MIGQPTRPHLDQLCEECNHPRGPAWPRDPALAGLGDQVLALMIAGAADAAVRVVCGSATYADGYRRVLVADFDRRELRHLVRVARERLEQLDRQIEPLARRQRRLVHLLTSAAPLDDDAAAIWPELIDPLIAAADVAADHDTPLAAVIPERTAAATNANRPTTTKEEKRK